MDNEEKLNSLSKILEKVSNENKFNVFSILSGEKDERDYEVIRHFLKPHERHDTGDYFIKKIVDIIKDRYQISGDSFMDLNVLYGCHVPGEILSREEYEDMELNLTAVSLTNKVFFVFIVETENVNALYTISWKKNYQKIVKQIDCIKELYKTYQVIPVLIIDCEHLGKRYDLFYTIPFKKIIDIMKDMLKEKVSDKHYKFILQEYIRQRELELVSLNHIRDGIPYERYLKFYSKYADEINTIQYYGSTYYIKKILLHIMNKKSFVDSITITDCNIDGSPSFTFLPSGLDKDFIEKVYKKEYMLCFDIHVYMHRIEVYFTIDLNDKMQLLADSLISLFNEKYNFNIKDKKGRIWLTIYKLDLNMPQLIYMDKKILINELDTALDDLYNKIIDVKNIILEVYKN